MKKELEDIKNRKIKNTNLDYIKDQKSAILEKLSKKYSDINILKEIKEKIEQIVTIDTSQKNIIVKTDTWKFW